MVHQGSLSLRARWILPGLALLVLIAPVRGDDNGRGATPIALANSGVVLRQNVWSVFYNPASTGTFQDLAASVFFVPGQFGMSELRTVAASAVIPVRHAVLGVGVESFGFSLYRESGVILSVARSIDDLLIVGLAFRGKHISIQRYGSTWVGSLDAGLHATILPDLSMGFAVRNLFATPVGQVNERPPHMLFIGASYTPIRGSTLYAEYESDIRYGGIFKGAFQQDILDVLILRIGLSSNPDKFSAGLAVKVASAEFSYAGYSHQDLGWTHQLELGFSFARGAE